MGSGPKSKIDTKVRHEFRTRNFENYICAHVLKKTRLNEIQNFEFSETKNQKSISEKQNPKSILFSKADRRFPKFEIPESILKMMLNKTIPEIKKKRNMILKTTEIDFISKSEFTTNKRFQKFKNRSEHLWKVPQDPRSFPWPF